MNKNLPIRKQNSKVELSKTKNLMGIANKILTNSDGLIAEDDSWIEKLWKWADENDIDDLRLEKYENLTYWNGFPRNKEKLLSLTELDLGCNELRLLPKEIGNLINLVWLEIADNKLTFLPKEIGYLSNLAELNLYENKLTILPTEIDKLVCLKKLNLNFNQLVELPKEIGGLVNLTWLEIADNNLTLVSKEIGNLSNLTVLYLDQNKLTKLPKEIGSLTVLIKLDLNFNSLTELPEEIVNLTKLKEMHLQGNKDLVLSKTQQEWIKTLKSNGCFVTKDNDLLDRTFKTPAPTKSINLALQGKISYDQERIIELSDGYEAWLDEDTGLMWEVKTQENVRQPYVYSKEWINNAMYPEDLIDDVRDIFSYAQKLNTIEHAGFSDWRVPSKEELETLMTENNFYAETPLGGNTLNLYWTSTTLENDSNLAYIGAFSTGSILDLEKNSLSYIRCVRGEKIDDSTFFSFSN